MVADPVPGVHDSIPRHHVVIAGTGRAGTSFLVRFLNQCGLDTGSSTDTFDERTRAGLEHNLLDKHAPYVVKDPWLFTYCEGVDLGAVTVDALLVPVREFDGGRHEPHIARTHCYGRGAIARLASERCEWGGRRWSGLLTRSGRSSSYSGRRVSPTDSLGHGGTNSVVSAGVSTDRQRRRVLD